jgi:hypothetical protein
MALDLTIRGGTVVTAAGTLDCDVGIREGRIAELGKGLKGERSIDARGKLLAARGRGQFLARERSAAVDPLGRQVPEMAQLAAWNTPLKL